MSKSFVPMYLYNTQNTQSYSLPLAVWIWSDYGCILT